MTYYYLFIFMKYYDDIINKCVDYDYSIVFDKYDIFITF